MENNNQHAFTLPLTDPESIKLFEDWRKSEDEYRELIRQITELETALVTMVKNDFLTIPLYDLHQVARIVRHFVNIKNPTNE